MSWTKGILLGIGSVFVGCLLVFTLGLAGLEWQKFFLPKQENIKRQVFEETQSYTHGKIQDLAKYYEEYNKAESVDDKEAISSLVRWRFAEFDESKIRSQELSLFLKNSRGY